MGLILLISGVIAALALLFGLFYKFWFLRDPLRLTPSGSNIVSPGDGRIIEIKEAKNELPARIRKGRGEIEARLSGMGGENYIIAIFMTPFDVHYQRAPYRGKVVDVAYAKGSFRSAGKPRPENENNQILIDTKIGRIKVIQIAGFMARRIVCFVKKGEPVKKGQKIGMIRLGSQVCLILPKSRKINLKIKKGDRLKAGESIIAEVK